MGCKVAKPAYQIFFYCPSNCLIYLHCLAIYVSHLCTVWFKEKILYLMISFVIKAWWPPKTVFHIVIECGNYRQLKAAIKINFASPTNFPPISLAALFSDAFSSSRRFWVCTAGHTASIFFIAFLMVAMIGLFLEDCANFWKVSVSSKGKLLNNTILFFA